MEALDRARIPDRADHPRVLILAYSFVSKNTIYGRHVYAIGGNLNAALLSGVKVKRTIFWVYVHMGLLAGIAGVDVLVAQQRPGRARATCSSWTRSRPASSAGRP